MPPPRCIISFEPKSDTDSSEIELIFSHSKYHRLYVKFLDQKIQDQPGPSHIERNIVGNAITVKTGLKSCLKNGFLIFGSEDDALRWKNLIPFCDTVELSGLLEARKELEIDEKPWLLKVRKQLVAEDFKKALEVPDARWESAWERTVAVKRRYSSKTMDYKKKDKRRPLSSEEKEQPEDGSEHGLSRLKKLWNKTERKT